jgi:transposase
MIAAVRSLVSVNESVLYVAVELGQKDWKVAMTSGFAAKPWLRTMAAGDLAAVERTIGAARRRFGVSATARVISCYEAGRDGFWIHRALQRLGIANRVVDSASIDVNRRARRMKTDRLDALTLVMKLVGHHGAPRLATTLRRILDTSQELRAMHGCHTFTPVEQPAMAG